MGVFDYEALRAAVELTFEDIATVYIQKGTETDENFQTRPKKEILYENIPCRISRGGATVSDRYNVAQNTGSAKLFTSPDVIIPDSSFIEVIRLGQKRVYKRTADVMHYGSQNEYSVELDGGSV